MSDSTAKLDRARGYPYELPGRSYVWRGDGRDPRVVDQFDPALTEGRTPVLAVGSNQSPLQLARKYGADSDHIIPVQQTTVVDFDVVYAAQITSYGAVPAMLQHAPGVDVTLYATWLDDAQLEIMHATEGNYHFAAIDDVTLRLDGGTVHRTIHLYVAKFGHLVHDDSAVSLAAVPARGRRSEARTTADMLRVVQARLGEAGDHDAFVLRLVDDLGFRRECIERLSENSVPFGHPYRVVES
ncbi:MAG: hypothetical protein MJE12_22840 [Alphaproteobacteria bacterium]|nr:hypothetical protein [Alphaproteobacteria bacterium]